MNKLSLLPLLLFISKFCLAQAPYVFTDFPGNAPGVIQQSHPYGFCIFKDKLYYSLNGGYYGEELWATDGTPAGTTLIADINPSPVGSYNIGSSPSEYTVLNDKMIFAATTASAGREIWITDGSTKGTSMLKDIYPGSAPSNPQYFNIVGNKIVFVATSPDIGSELWVTDGTATGTTILKDIRPSNAMVFFSFFTAYNNKIYFQANNGMNGAELWETDGTPAGTKMVVDIAPGSASSNPSSLTVMNNKLYFYATTTAEGSELWVTDGSAAGTHIVKDIYTGYQSAFSSISVNPIPDKLATYNNKLYFSALDGIHGYELWCSDGTDTGTYLVKDINTGTANSYSVNQYMLFNDKLYFSAFTEAHGSELWVTDGSDTGTKLVVDFSPGTARSVPAYFCVYNNHLFYRCRNADGDFHLVKSDGTAAGTTIIKPVGSNATDPLFSTRELFVYDSAMYFEAEYDNHGNELWSLKDTTGLSINPPAPLDTNKTSSISVFPNPGKGIYYLECKGVNITSTAIAIFDIAGNLVREITVDKQTVKIDISDLAPAVYTMKLRINNTPFTHRLIKTE